MEKIKNFVLPIYTNELYTKEAISSISLTRDIADKINELIDAYNSIHDGDIVWKQEMEGTVRKGVLYMKDNLLNSIRELLELYMNSDSVDHILTDLINGKLNNIVTRLEDIVSVKEFGAMGDGIHNDTHAVDAAIHSGASVIYFPKGTYKIDSILLHSNITLTGDGVESVLLHNDRSGSHFITHVEFEEYATGEMRENTTGCISNVRIEKLCVKGSHVKNKHGIALYGFNNILHDVTIYDFNGCGVYLESPGKIHSTPEYNLQNDISNLTVYNCEGMNMYYNGQSDSVFNNILSYYTEKCETTNFYLGNKAHGCKFNGVHLWGECETHLIIDSEGCTFTNLHCEGAFTQIEVNNRFTSMQVEVYDPIHLEGGSTGFKFGKNAGNFLCMLSARNIETIFDYQGNAPYGHNISGHVSQNIDGVLFTSYPTAAFINIQWYKNGQYKWETITPWATLKDTWTEFNTKTAPIFGVNGEKVLATVNNGSPTSYVVIENGNSVRGCKVRMSGSEANADLQLEPKGNGKIRFGSYINQVSEVAGYIEIKDANGNIRKLACLK